MNSSQADNSLKKHPCADCRVCQWCSDARCASCLGMEKQMPRLSMSEQIALYERLNREAREDKCTCGCAKENSR